jgi:tRNA1Val (adenine37-N6)-methyltransferase
LAEYTADTLFDPPLTLFQPRTGYRFSLDPIILAAHVLPSPGDRIMDIGCGCGILSLILAGRNPDVRITGIEIQKTLARAAQKNVAKNRMGDRIRILHQDICTLESAPAGALPGNKPDSNSDEFIKRNDVPAPVDLIVSNPPYIKKTTGRLNPDRGRALARHEITLDIGSLALQSNRLLPPEGRLCLIFPASRTADLTAALDTAGFQTDWMRYVHFLPEETAQRVLVCAVKSGSGPAACRPPLYLYHPDGTPTDAHQALLQW